MAVQTARFAHCHVRRPVEYRPKSPFRPLVSAPLDFAVRVGQAYTLDRELDRAVLRVEDYGTILDQAVAAQTRPGGPTLPARRTTAYPVDAAATETAEGRRRFALNELRLTTEAARFRPPWTPALLREVHATLFDRLDAEDRGGALRNQAYTARSETGAPIFHAVPPDRIVEELDAVLEWVDRFGATYHPLVPATVLFQSIYTIHPFPMGNIRVGRTMALLYLRLFGLPNVSLAPVALAASRSSELTVRLLLWTEATGSYAELLDHTADILVQAYAEANHRWLGPASPAGRLDEVMLRLVARARRDPGWFSTQDAMRWVGARSDQTILRYLNDLVGRRILESLGQTRGKRFRLASPASILPVLPEKEPVAAPAKAGARSPRRRVGRTPSGSAPTPGPERAG